MKGLLSCIYNYKPSIDSLSSTRACIDRALGYILYPYVALDGLDALSRLTTAFTAAFIDASLLGVF